MLRRVLLPMLLLLPLPVFAQAPSAADGETWWRHVKTLADDSLEGRETGSDGERKAKAYVVAELERLGMAYFNPRIDLAPEVEAPLVFVGYGLSVPESAYDDFAGLVRSVADDPERPAWKQDSFFRRYAAHP
jgi:hypothetical protein